MTLARALHGRDAVPRKRDQGCAPLGGQTTRCHNEAIVRDGRIVGTVTSGNCGHHLGGAVGMGCVPCECQDEADVLGSSYEIEIAGERFAAEASLKPMYDPGADRARM